MILVDSSVIVTALTAPISSVASWLDRDDLHAPHLVDPEVLNGLRSLAIRGAVDEEALRTGVEHWRALSLVRHPTNQLVDRVWTLRSNVTAYDATWIALAEALGAKLVTRDERLSKLPITVTAEIEVV